MKLEHLNEGLYDGRYGIWGSPDRIIKHINRYGEATLETTNGVYRITNKGRNRYGIHTMFSDDTMNTHQLKAWLAIIEIKVGSRAQATNPSKETGYGAPPEEDLNG